MSKLRAPNVQEYIDWLKRIDYGHWGENTAYDEGSYQLIDELYQELDKIPSNVEVAKDRENCGFGHREVPSMNGET